MRMAYFLNNLKTLFFVWLFGSLLGFVLFVSAHSRDGGMIVMGLLLGLVFVISATDKLNSLVKIPDDRFMVNCVFWLGNLGFGLLAFAARSSLGVIISIIGHSILVALVTAVVIWYITGIQERKKALE